MFHSTGDITASVTEGSYLEMRPIWIQKGNLALVSVWRATVLYITCFSFPFYHSYYLLYYYILLCFQLLNCSYLKLQVLLLILCPIPLGQGRREQLHGA